MQLTRRPRGLPLWYSLSVHGTDQYRAAVDHGIRLAREIADEIVRRDGLSLVRDPQPDDIVTEWQGNLAEAERLGIFGTPTYVVNGELFWGQDRLEFVSRALGALKQQLSQSAVRTSA